MIPSRLISKGLSPSFGHKLFPVPNKDTLEGQEYPSPIKMKNKEENSQTTLMLNKLIEKIIFSLILRGYTTH